MIRLLFLLPFVAQAPAAKEVAKPIPEDFKIVAQYGSGYSSWKSWKDTITADGKVSQEIFDYPKSNVKESKLSSDEVKELLVRIKEAEFSKLPEKSGAFHVTDQDTMILEITADGKKHKAYIYGYWHMKETKETDEMKRFSKVWREVLKKVPSPNPEQKPEDFDR